jgi:DNA-binding winged helix-turn-helix (wHTH) protein
MKETSDPAAVRFGPFLFEPINGRLLRAGAELGVPPRALAILGCLIARPGLLVTKQDLLDQVWKDAFVTDTSLSEAVSVLRQALGDDAQTPSYVQTVPRRGYRFVADVEPASFVSAIAAPATTVGSTPAAAPLWTPWLPWLGCFAAGLAFGLLAVALPRPSATDTAPVTRFTLALPAGHRLASGPSLAVSGDGSLIVSILEDAERRRGAWVRPLDASAFQFLPGSEGAHLPFVSADGDRIGVVVGDRVQAMTMPSGAWTTVTTASLVRGATWLADGSVIIASGADGALRKVPARGGEAAVIARPRYDLGESALATPTRVGTMELVFGALRPGRDPLLYAWPAAASAPRPLLSGSAPQWIGPSHVLFRSADRLHAAVVSPPEWSIARTSMLATQGLLAPDDVYAATSATFVRTATCRDCAAVNLMRVGDGNHPVFVPGSGVEAWRLSIDGTAVIAIARHGENRQVWRLGLDDESAVLLDRGHAYATATDSAGRLTVAAAQYDGTWEIRALTPSASWLTPVRDAVPLEPSAVTTAGDVWFHKRGAGGSLDIWAAAAGGTRAVVATAADEWDAQPSPDGRYLAWISDARGETEVVVRDERSGETLGTWPADEARWTPDGATLLVGVDRRWQALAVSADADSRLSPTALPAGIRVPGSRPATTDLEVVLQWARDVRRHAPVLPRPLPVVR